MNPILSSHFKRFRASHGQIGENEADAFEAFTLHLITKQYHCDQLDLLAHCVGGSEDEGIDSIVVLVDGKPHHPDQDLDRLLEKNENIDVCFEFIQAKRSPKFDSGEIGKFCFGVEQFFSDNPVIKFKEDLTAFRSLKNSIYDRADLFNSRPKLFAYYATSGEWKNPPSAIARFEQLENNLTALNIFDQISWQAPGAEELIQAAKTLSNRTKATLKFEGRALLPSISKVPTSHIGYVSFKDYVNLVTDSSGRLIRSLFNDNVRDFQGDNPVNQDIEESAKGSPDHFVLMNNGVTIVAKEAKQVGESFTLTDFQIVNGCQTSNILCSLSDPASLSGFVPIKLICTEDTEVIANVIQATNRQTTVAPEAFESLQPFHKHLEDYYEASRTESLRLYYERRSKQYEQDSAIPTYQVVSLSRQTQAFAAVFLEQPDRAGEYYGKVLEFARERIYLDGHDPAPYFAAAAVQYRIASMLADGALPRKYRRWRFHIGLLFRRRVQSKSPPPLGSKKQQQYCEPLILCLSDTDRARRTINDCRTQLDTATNGVPHHQLRRLHTSEEFVNKLLGPSEDRLNTPVSEQLPGEGTIQRGKIKVYYRWKNFGFIESGGSDNIFAHDNDLRKIPLRKRYTGIPVKFLLENSPRGPAASNVQIDEAEFAKRADSNSL